LDVTLAEVVSGLFAHVPPRPKLNVLKFTNLVWEPIRRHGCFLQQWPPDTSGEIGKSSEDGRRQAVLVETVARGSGYLRLARIEVPAGFSVNECF
jgi:hypothetical protein